MVWYCNNLLSLPKVSLIYIPGWGCQEQPVLEFPQRRDRTGRPSSDRRCWGQHHHRPVRIRCPGHGVASGLCAGGRSMLRCYCTCGRSMLRCHCAGGRSMLRCHCAGCRSMLRCHCAGRRSMIRCRLRRLAQHAQLSAAQVGQHAHEHQHQNLVNLRH